MYKSDSRRVSEIIPLDLARRIFLISSTNPKDTDDPCVDLSNKVLDVIQNNLRGYERLANRIDRLGHAAISAITGKFTIKAVSVMALHKFLQCVIELEVPLDNEFMNIWADFTELVNSNADNDRWLVECDDEATELFLNWLDVYQKNGFYKNIEVIAA